MTPIDVISALRDSAGTAQIGDEMKKIAKPNAAVAVPVETALILRTCNADMTSYGGFRWPTSGQVEAPDWNPAHVCGGGLHGLLWGEGSVQYLNLSDDAKWIVFRALLSDVAHGTGELMDKCKARRGIVELCGSRDEAIAFLIANGASGKMVVFGTATAGYRGTATAGDRGTVTAGMGGVISILRWNGKRFKVRAAQVKEEDGDGELEPNIPYRLDNDGNWKVAIK